MKESVLKIILTCLFVGLLSLPVIIQIGARSEKKAISTKLDKEYLNGILRRDGFFLVDFTETAGIDFVHRPAYLDPKLKHIAPFISSTGASVSVCDFNNDGWNDFYMTTSRQGENNALYRNEQDGTFINVAEEMDLALLNDYSRGVSQGAVWGNIDNDGFEDLFIYKWGKPVLFKNERGTGFSDITNRSEFPVWANSNSAIWFDFNNDGLLDLFIGGYFPENLNLWKLSDTFIMPESYEYAGNGGRNYLMINQGNGKFRDITQSSGLSSTKWTLAAGAIDLDEDGFQDLVIANDYGIDEVYINQEGKSFLEIGKTSGIGFSPKSGMNVSFGDILNNGELSIYISNITEMGILLQGNNLWMNKSRKNQLAFENQAQKRGVYNGGWSYGSQFLDINNDGNQDIYVANGFISGTQGNSYWYDYSKIVGGNKAIISDAANWPAIQKKSQSGFQQNIIWLNNGEGFFYDASGNISNQATYDSRAIAFADLWNNGTLDILVANQNNRMILYKNIINEENNWITVALEGTISNQSAIGAVVSLYWDGKKQSQVISGGIGFSSQNHRRIHFGLGNIEHVEKIIVRWPSGIVSDIIGPSINRLHKIVEPS